MVNPGVVQMVVSGSRRPARTPASSSSSRRAHAAGSSPGASVPAGTSHSVPPVASTSYASIDRVARWFAGKSSRRVILVSDGFHMLRLRIVATRKGLVPFTSPAPGSPIRASPRRNAGFILAEGVKVPIAWLFQH